MDFVGFVDVIDLLNLVDLLYLFYLDIGEEQGGEESQGGEDATGGEGSSDAGEGQILQQDLCGWNKNFFWNILKLRRNLEIYV